MCVCTFYFDSALVAVIRASQTDMVIEIFGCTDTLVAAIVAVIFTVAHERLIDAFAIVAHVHAVAIDASLSHLIIIELLLRLKRTGQADVAVTQ